ncbi:MAG TPA: bifunctional DNA-formamidopyrimidine glycosylase/DNA-(apurinic or apyrimidinic site) lyase [Propionibacteriaceae bacterium]|nr:bifunctional DNA-formamidopyrimidine glycosylase/DNA-(apurinic or apyrimidinic site) lyase [Propionibacteriaceae bacterium]
MPELPEVETVRRGLEPFTSGRTVASVDLLHPRPVRRHLAGPDDFTTTLVGRRFEAPRRRGKYLWLPFDDGDALLAHLGMSGQFRVNQPGDALLPNTRVILRFADEGPEVRFVDQRMFGGLSISPGGALLPEEIAHIAPDPFDPDYDQRAVLARLRSRAVGVKRQLLDQTLVSGVGNIYADEALWRAGVHGDTPGLELGPRRARRVLDAAREVMAEALDQGGTSFDALYVRVNGTSGYFDRSLHAYGRAGEPCDRCGTPIVRDHFMNRSSYRCPRCQRPAPRPRAVATRAPQGRLSARREAADG